MDKGLTVPKCVLINRPKIPKMAQNLSAQIVCPSPEIWDFDENRLYWASVVPEKVYELTPTDMPSFSMLMRVM